MNIRNANILDPKVFAYIDNIYYNFPDLSENEPGYSERVHRELSPYYGQPLYAFGEIGYKQHHHQMLRDEGLVCGECIARKCDLFDNQLWSVCDMKSGDRYVMKVISLHNHMDDMVPNRDNLQMAVRGMQKESKTLLFLNHQNIVKVIREFSLPDPSTGVPFLFHCFLMDQMDEDLIALLDKQPDNCLPEPMAREWFRQIADAVDHLHNGLREPHGVWISHMAIRPANILCKRIDNSDKRIYKLTDFEESVCFNVSDRDIYSVDRHYGPYRHIGDIPTKSIDVWDLGVCLAITLVGWDLHVNLLRYLANTVTEPDIHPISRNELTHEELDVFCGVNLDLCALMAWIIQTPDNRPTIAQVLTNYCNICAKII